MRGKWRAWSWWTRGAVIALALVLVVTLPVVGVVVALLTHNIGEQSEQARTRGKDAVWLGHAWVDGRKTDADIDGLGKLLAGTGIRDLYVHTGPLEHDGSLRDELAPRAHWFVDAVHARLPGIRVQSWLGDLVRPEYDGLDLESAASRERVVASARRVLAYGFDGVHYDLEPRSVRIARFSRAARRDPGRDVGGARPTVGVGAGDRSAAGIAFGGSGRGRSREMVEPGVFRRGRPPCRSGGGDVL